MWLVFEYTASLIENLLAVICSLWNFFSQKDDSNDKFVLHFVVIQAFDVIRRFKTTIHVLLCLLITQEDCDSSIVVSAVSIHKLNDIKNSEHKK